jgi:hypothetical protein
MNQHQQHATQRTNPIQLSRHLGKSGPIEAPDHEPQHERNKGNIQHKTLLSILNICSEVGCSGALATLSQTADAI